jgi:enoyl-CoA hydratase/carnithine racemase
MPGLRFGVVLGTRRLAYRVGSDRAREILGTSRTFSSDEALAGGFLTAVAPQADWPGIVGAAQSAAETLAPAAAAALRRRTVTDSRAEDMMELARSVSTPGLKERIRRYRETSK